MKPRSELMEKLWERSKKVTPGGVHSPVRAFKGVGGTPVFMERADGSVMTDVDGDSYIDYCMSWGALILGHQHPTVREEVHAAINRGWIFGTTDPYSLELSEWIIKEIPFLDQVRLVCSGTEAVMSALRLARAFTRRPKILKFEGCYHGHADHMLVKAGSGLAEAAQPDSLGLSPQQAADTLVCPLDDEVAFDKILTMHGSEIAGVILEPLPANNGLLPQRTEFLQFLRMRTKDVGALLIFDEVISGFRVGLQGIAGLTGIIPDLVTYGKVMGGGMPIGAYAGRRDIMAMVAPAGGMYQAGTLAGNPLGSVAGLTTLKILKQEKIHDKLEQLGQRLESSLRPALADAHMNLVRQGSVFWMSPSATTLRSISQLPDSIKTTYPKLFHHCLKEGVYLAPSGYEVGFLNAQLTTAQIDRTVNVIREALAART